MGVYLFETHPANKDKLRSLLKSKRLKIIAEYDMAGLSMYIFKVSCTYRIFTTLVSLSSLDRFTFTGSEDKVPELQKKITKPLIIK